MWPHDRPGICIPVFDYDATGEVGNEKIVGFVELQPFGSRDAVSTLPNFEDRRVVDSHLFKELVMLEHAVRAAAEDRDGMTSAGDVRTFDDAKSAHTHGDALTNPVPVSVYIEPYGHAFLHRIVRGAFSVMAAARHRDAAPGILRRPGGPLRTAARQRLRNRRAGLGCRPRRTANTIRLI